MIAQLKSMFAIGTHGSNNRLASNGEINGDAVDRFTAVHAGFGALMAAANVPPWAAVTVAIGWEFIERPLKDHLPSVFPNATQDTMSNAVADVIAMLGGYYVTRKVIRRCR